MPMVQAHNRRRQAKRPNGFTLVELLITMTVFAILAALAVPSFTRMLATNRMSTQTNEFVMALNTAKSEAVRRGQAVTLRGIYDTNPNYFHQGWLAFTDGDSDGLPADPATEADGTSLRDMSPLAGTTTVTRVTRSGTAPSFTYPPATSSLSSRQYITFTARGGTTAGGPSFFRICDSANPTIPGRIVQVSVVGRVFLDSTNEDCSS